MGGDDFTLGENHVSTVQEGEGCVAPPSPGKICPSYVPPILINTSPIFSKIHLSNKSYNPKTDFLRNPGPVER